MLNNLQGVLQIVEHVPAFRRDIVGAAHGGQRNIRFGGDDTLRQFGFAHFQAEDDGGHAVVQRRRTREVDAERGLAHGRSARHDNHLSRLQTLRHIVDVTKSGRHAA